MIVALLHLCVCVSDARRARAPSKKKFDEEMEALCTGIRNTEEQLEALVSFHFWTRSVCVCVCVSIWAWPYPEEFKSEATKSTSVTGLRARGLCESRSGYPGLRIPNGNSPYAMVPVDVKQHWTWRNSGEAQNNHAMVSVDVKQHWTWRNSGEAQNNHRTTTEQA